MTSPMGFALPHSHCSHNQIKDLSSLTHSSSSNLSLVFARHRSTNHVSRMSPTGRQQIQCRENCCQLYRSPHNKQQRNRILSKQNARSWPAKRLGRSYSRSLHYWRRPCRCRFNHLSWPGNIAMATEADEESIGLLCVSRRPCILLASRHDRPSLVDMAKPGPSSKAAPNFGGHHNGQLSTEQEWHSG